MPSQKTGELEFLGRVEFPTLFGTRLGITSQAVVVGLPEAYIRLVDVEKAQHWNSRGHFLGWRRI